MGTRGSHSSDAEGRTGGAFTTIEEAYGGEQLMQLIDDAFTRERWRQEATATDASGFVGALRQDLDEHLQGMQAAIEHCVYQSVEGSMQELKDVLLQQMRWHVEAAVKVALDHPSSSRGSTQEPPEPPEEVEKEQAPLLGVLQEALKPLEDRLAQQTGLYQRGLVAAAAAASSNGRSSRRRLPNLKGMSSPAMDEVAQTIGPRTPSGHTPIMSSARPAPHPNNGRCIDFNLEPSVEKESSTRYPSTPNAFLLHPQRQQIDLSELELEPVARQLEDKKSIRATVVQELPLLVKVVESRCIKAIQAALVLANFVWLCWMCERDTKESLSRHHVRAEGWLQGLPMAVFTEQVVETNDVPRFVILRDASTVSLCFTGLFLLEVSLKILVSPKRFIGSEYWRFNCFDALVVLLDATDVAVSSLLLQRPARLLPDITFLRLVWFFRQAIEIRQGQLLHFTRTMFMSIVNSAMLMWCVFFVLAGLTCLFSLMLQHGVIGLLQGSPVGAISEAHLSDLAANYGGLGITMLSLMMAITGGKDWASVLEPLRDVPSIYTMLFLWFIGFAILGVLNVITGIFVEVACQVTQRNKKEKVRAKVMEQDRLKQDIQEIFHAADADASGTLSWEEFKQHLKHPVITAYFQSLELDFSEASGLFALLDHQGTGQVKVEEFVKGCMELRGEAKSIDLATLRYEFHRFAHRVEAFIGSASRQLEELLMLSDGGSESDLASFGSDAEATPARSRPRRPPTLEFVEESLEEPPVEQPAAPHEGPAHRNGLSKAAHGVDQSPDSAAEP